MHDYVNYIAEFSCLTLIILAYVGGVRRGRSAGSRLIIKEFNQVVFKLLGYAAKQDYRSLHLMLVDLVDDDDVASKIPFNEPEKHEQQESILELTRDIEKYEKKED